LHGEIGFHLICCPDTKTHANLLQLVMAMGNLKDKKILLGVQFIDDDALTSVDSTPLSLKHGKACGSCSKSNGAAAM
jgi:hypothetical protein